MSQASKFPTALAAIADFFGEYLGTTSTELTLNADITSGALTFVVNEAIPASWPQVSILTIENEQILIDSYNAGTKTFTVNAAGRGYQGSTASAAAAAHTAGNVVGLYINHTLLNQIIAELVAIETQQSQGADIASGATITPGADGQYAHITGTTGITAIASRRKGYIFIMEFTGILTITHNGTSLIMRNGLNATTAAGDIYTFISEGAGNWRELFHTTNVAGTPSTAAATMHLTEDFIFTTPLTGNAIGSLNWTLAATGGAMALVAGVAGHPGIVQLSSGAGASGFVDLVSRLLASPISLIPSEFFDIIVVLRPSSTVDVNMIVEAGLGDTNDQNAPPNNGIYIEKATADTQYFGVCRTGNVQTRTAAFGNVVNGTWTKFRIRRVDASTIGFTQDNGTEVTLTTNIPTLGLNPMMKVANITNALARTVDFDLYDIQITGLTR